MLIQFNNIYFRHAHRLANGKIITHAHPFKPVSSSPIQPNGHGSNELLLLDALSNGLYAPAFEFSFVCAAKISQIIVERNSYYSVPSFSALFYCFAHRGPPVLTNS